MILKDFFLRPGMLFLLVPLASGPAHSTPQINAVIGDITQDQTITIQGTGFSNKVNPQPLFWWRADGSTTAKDPSQLGRKTVWDNPIFNGTPSTAIVAPGSQQSLAWDHGLSSDAALTSLDIDSDRLYLHRKLYEDFDVVKNIAIRTMVDTASMNGTVTVGDTITGDTSGATGVVIKIYADANDTLEGTYPLGRTSIYYNNIDGTVNADPPIDFLNGENMRVTAGTGTATTMTNIDPYGVDLDDDNVFDTGILRSFNYKPIRFWYLDPNYKISNDILMAAQGTEGPSYRISPEYTDNTVWLNSMNQSPFRWNTEEVEYRASTLDVKDGVWNFYQNGVLPPETRPIITRTTDYPELLSTLYQSQVSNGAQPGSVVYYDSLYIDDSWHRVMICRNRLWADCTQPEVQIPTSWNDSSITVQLNFGGLNRSSSLFLYVFDENGLPNTEGYALCPKCPLQPTVQ